MADRWVTVWHPSRDASGAVAVPSRRQTEAAPGPGRDRSRLTPASKTRPTGSTRGAARPARRLRRERLPAIARPTASGSSTTRGPTSPASTARAAPAGSTRSIDDRGLEGLAAAGPVADDRASRRRRRSSSSTATGWAWGASRPPEQVHYQGYFLDHPEAVRSIHAADGRDLRPPGRQLQRPTPLVSPRRGRPDQAGGRPGDAGDRRRRDARGRAGPAALTCPSRPAQPLVKIPRLRSTIPDRRRPRQVARRPHRAPDRGHARDRPAAASTARSIAAPSSAWPIRATTSTPSSSSSTTSSRSTRTSASTTSRTASRCASTGS